MFRTCVLGCALACATALSVGCGKDAKPTSKEESVKVHKAVLTGLDKSVDDLKAKAEKAAGEEKTKLDAKWKAAGEKRDAAKKKLDELEKAAADKWEAVEKDLKTALADAATAVKE
ncbi:MAG: hypothetical protein FJ304_09800 [Planctomycetes bacterium]|nr:hypothetical protein [Planctomycetota bacterium]